MPQILQVRLQQYVNWELPDIQAGFRKGKGTRDEIANICWIIEKAWESQKKYLNEPDNHDGVVSHPEPDILKCEVRWALGSTDTSKDSESNENLLELFKTL